MRIHLDCDSSFSRPVVNLDNIFLGCQALIDTGALFPVWTASEESLKTLGARPDPILSKGVITGFGSHRLDIDTRSNQIVYHMHHEKSDDGTLVLVNG